MKRWLDGLPLMWPKRAGDTFRRWSRKLNLVASSVQQRTLSRPSLEALEDRCCPSITIQIDYRYDTRGFFNRPVRRAMLQRAADTIGRQLQDHLEAITPGGENNWSAFFPHPATGRLVELPNLSVPEDTLIVFAGARNLGFPLGMGSPGNGLPSSGGIEWTNRVFSRGQLDLSAEAPTDLGPWGGVVTFNRKTNWYFGTSPKRLGFYQYDFYSVALHELCHLLGFGSTAAFYRLISRSRFTGPHAMAEYNRPGNVPVNVAAGHWAAWVRDGGRRPVMSAAGLPNGVRRGMTALDWAALDDIGWTISRPQVTQVIPVAPDPRTSAVSSIDVVMSEAVRLRTFTAADLRLTRDGGPNLINKRVTVTHVSGTTYRIGNLAGLTNTPGIYVLTVRAGGVRNAAGHAGIGSASESWVRQNLAPTAVDDAVNVTPGRSGKVRVLLNDSEPDGQPLRLSLVSSPAHGTAVVGKAYIFYTPAPGYHGMDSFLYQVDDGMGGTSTATVNVGVTRNPVAVNDAAVTAPSAPVRINALANDTDADGDPLQLSIISAPARGAIVINDNGTPDDLRDDYFVYTPAPGSHDTDSFIYQVEDGFGSTATARVTVTMQGIGLDQDPADSTKKALVVVGTRRVDVITFQPANAAGAVRATLARGRRVLSQGTFDPATDDITRLIAYGQAGNDSLSVLGGVMDGSTVVLTLPAILDGGPGKDRLNAAAAVGNTILLGGPGVDSLIGGVSRDILVGGLGADTLRGNGGDDVLIGNRAFDADVVALLSLMEEWQPEDVDYATRAAHLLGTSGGDNEPNYLTAATVLADSAIDQLFGNADEDLFLILTASRRRDRVRDGVDGEVNPL